MAPALTEPLSPENLSTTLALNVPLAEEAASNCQKPHAHNNTSTSTTTTATVNCSSSKVGRSIVQYKGNDLNDSAKSKRNEQMGLSVALNNNNNNHNHNNNNNNNNNTKNNSSKQLNVETSATSECSPFQENSTERRLLADLTSNFEEAICAEICLRNQLLVDCNFDKVGVTQPPSAAALTTTEATSEPKAFRICEDSCRVYTTTTNPSKSTHTSHMESETKATTNVLENVNVEADAEEDALGLREAVKAVAAEVAAHHSQFAENPPLSPEFYEKLQVEEDDDEECHKEMARDHTKAVKSAEFTEHSAAPELRQSSTHAGAPQSGIVSAVAVNEQHFYGGGVTKKKPDDNHTARIISVEELPPIRTDSTMTASEAEDNLEERLSQLDGMPSTVITRDTNVAMLGENAMCTTPATPPQTPQHQQETSTAATTPSSQQRIAELQEQLQRIPAPSPQTQQSQTPQSNATARCSSSLKETIGADAGTLEDHDIEEMLKVLKGFDAHAGTDTLGDLNLLFSEDCNTLNYEDIAGQQNAHATSSAVSLNANTLTASAATIVSSTSATMAIQSPAASPLREAQTDIGKKQQSLQRKLDFLERRLRKLQARYMCRHASEEIGGLFEYSLRSFTKRTQPAEAVDNPLGTSVISSRPRDDHWTQLGTEPLFKTEMSAMLQRIDTVGSSQTVCTTPSTSGTTSLIGVTTVVPRKTRKSHATAAATAATVPSVAKATDAPAGGLKDECVVVPTYDPFVSAEMGYVSEVLHTQMQLVQDAIDSDATESSSGADSADEMLTFTNQLQQSQSIGKRAAWRYACDRAATASRWSWLLSQIADLEIKIRQYQELYQEVVRTKGPILCDHELEASLSKGMAANTAAAAAPSNGGDLMNGLLERCQRNVGPASKEMDADDEANALPGSCRTRGYVPSVFRKRKLLQTINIHQISKKAARPSTIKCGCESPQLPCAVCTGRSDPTAPRDLPDTMMKADRVALLDPGYHSVLSFPQDVDSSIYLEAIAGSPEWQNRVLRCQVKSMAKSLWKAERAEAAIATLTLGGSHYLSKKYGDLTGPLVKRRYIKKKDRLAGGAQCGRATLNATASESSAVNSAADGTQTVNVSVNESRGNGIGTLSTSATPLGVANMLGGGDANQMDTLSPMAVLNHIINRQLQQQQRKRRRNNNNSSTSRHRRKLSDYRLPNYDQYKPNQAHSSLISQHQHSNNHNTSSSSTIKTNKHRNKMLSAAAATGGYHYNHNNNQQHNNQQNNNNSLRNSQSTFNNIHHQYNGNNNNNSETTNLPADNQWESTSVRSRNSSPTHWGINSYYKYERSSDRKNRTSYDIDNIVIPYSVAAATRVEILPYKEIPTPKWRVIGKENESKCDSQLTDDETAELKAATTALTNGLGPELTNEKGATSGEGLFKEPQNDPKSVNIKTAELLNEKPPQTPNVKELPAALGETKENISLNKIAAPSSDTKEPTPLRITRSSNAHSKTTETLSTTTTTATTTVNNADVEEPLLKKPKLSTSAPKAKHTATPTPATYTNRVVILSEENRFYGNENEDAENGASGSADDDAHDEDITDDAITLRHERALAEERKKFQTFLKFPWSTRSRANRRIDSRAESSGANTPDPASPAPQTPSISGGDQESIPSPLAPSTPINPLDNASEAGETNVTSVLPPVVSSKRLERRRTTSTKKDRELERRSATPDLRELIPPYEPLQFPLSDEEFNNLMRSMSTDDSYNHNNNYCSGANKTASRSRRSSGFVAINAPFTVMPSGAASATTTSIKRNSKSSPAAHCDVSLSNKRKLHNNNIASASIKEHNATAVGPTTSLPTNENHATELPSTSSTTAPENTRLNGKLLEAVLPTAIADYGGAAVDDCIAPVAVDSQGDDNDDDDDETEADDDNDDDDDVVEDDYANNYLVTNDEDYTMDEAYIDDEDDEDGFDAVNGFGGFDEKFNSFVGHQKLKRRARLGLGGLSDEESSEPEPFQDDDPNDPEWKGSLRKNSKRVLPH